MSVQDTIFDIKDAHDSDTDLTLSPKECGQVINLIIELNQLETFLDDNYHIGATWRASFSKWKDEQEKLDTTNSKI